MANSAAIVVIMMGRAHEQPDRFRWRQAVLPPASSAVDPA
jgi:hypothetical protein